jgi:ABC-type proline/glycine betaine transport system permease subunit
MVDYALILASNLFCAGMGILLGLWYVRKAQRG